MRNRYLKTTTWIKGEHKDKNKGRGMKYHMHLKSTPIFKEIIWWIKSLVTTVRGISQRRRQRRTEQ
jgi:hypothetical protein